MSEQVDFDGGVATRVKDLKERAFEMARATERRVILT